MICDHQKEIGS